MACALTVFAASIHTIYAASIYDTSVAGSGINKRELPEVFSSRILGPVERLVLLFDSFLPLVTLNFDLSEFPSLSYFFDPKRLALSLEAQRKNEAIKYDRLNYLEFLERFNSTMQKMRLKANNGFSHIQKSSEKEPETAPHLFFQFPADPNTSNNIKSYSDGANFDRFPNDLSNFWKGVKRHPKVQKFVENFSLKIMAKVLDLLQQEPSFVASKKASISQTKISLDILLDIVSQEVLPLTLLLNSNHDSNIFENADLESGDNGDSAEIQKQATIVTPAQYLSEQDFIGLAAELETENNSEKNTVWSGLVDTFTDIMVVSYMLGHVYSGSYMKDGIQFGGFSPKEPEPGLIQPVVTKAKGFALGTLLGGVWGTYIGYESLKDAQSKSSAFKGKTSLMFGAAVGNILGTACGGLGSLTTLSDIDSISWFESNEESNDDDNDDGNDEYQDDYKDENKCENISTLVENNLLFWKLQQFVLESATNFKLLDQEKNPLFAPSGSIYKERHINKSIKSCFQAESSLSLNNNSYNSGPSSLFFNFSKSTYGNPFSVSARIKMWESEYVNDLIESFTIAIPQKVTLYKKANSTARKSSKEHSMVWKVLIEKADLTQEDRNEDSHGNDNFQKSLRQPIYIRFRYHVGNLKSVPVPISLAVNSSYKVLAFEVVSTNFNSFSDRSKVEEDDSLFSDGEIIDISEGEDAGSGSELFPTVRVEKERAKGHVRSEEKRPTKTKKVTTNNSNEYILKWKLLF